MGDYKFKDGEQVCIDGGPDGGPAYFVITQCARCSLTTRTPIGHCNPDEVECGHVFDLDLTSDRVRSSSKRADGTWTSCGPAPRVVGSQSAAST